MNSLHDKTLVTLTNNGIFPITHNKDGELLPDLPQTGFNISGTFQGEGKLAGTPSIFLRFSRCNLNCWVDDSGKKYQPKVVPLIGQQKSLKQCTIGDILLATDDIGNIVTTKVVNLLNSDNIFEYYKIKTSIGVMYVTGEHKFLTVSDGWVKAEDLTSNHVLQHIHSKDIRQYKARPNHKPWSADYRPDFELYKRETYEQSGYSVLVLNNKDTDDELKKQILNFYRNGIDILQIKKITKNIPVSSYNIQCAPYENYLINMKGNYLMSHNCAWYKDTGSELCDTSYSSFTPEVNKMSVRDIVNTVKHNIGDNIKHIVITGGEPFIQILGLRLLVKEFKDLGLHITIETNGTIYDEEITKYVDLFSISPKLSSSTPWQNNVRDTGIRFSEPMALRHDKLRYSVSVLQAFVDECYLDRSGYGERSYKKRNYLKDFQLKFVVSNLTDFIEIKENYVDRLYGVINNDIYIMLLGATNESLQNTPKNIYKEIIKRGWNFTPRLHISLFGDKRDI